MRWMEKEEESFPSARFPGNKQSAECEKEVDQLLKKYLTLGADMSFKIHFLQSHLDYLPWNCGILNEEQGECFHKGIPVME